MSKPIVLLTAVVADIMGSMLHTPEEELEETKKDFSELLAPAEFDIYQPYSCYPGEFKPGTQLVIFDYGGMMAGNSLLEDNSRHLIQYAEDNPSTLCVVNSTTTWGNGIRWELESKGLLSLHNLARRYFYKGDGSFDKEPEDWDPIPAWFRDMYNLPAVGMWAPLKALKLKKPRAQ